MSQGPAYSTVSSGKAVPFLVKYSKPAKRSMNSGLGMSEPKAMMAAFAAYIPFHPQGPNISMVECKLILKGGGRTGMTSFPIPSAGMRPILMVCLALVAIILTGVLRSAIIDVDASVKI